MSTLSITDLWSRISPLDIARPIGEWIGDLVFPPVCAGCGRVDFRFCHSCAMALEDLPVTPIKARAPHLNATCATGKHRGLLRKLVIALKHNDMTELAEPLAARLHKAISADPWSVDAIVPVPLSSDRLADRGYNQSELLGRNLSGSAGISCQPGWLQRTRHTGQQVGLSEEARRENVKDAFEASADVQGQSILLIDDVMTTGSTLGECALALRAKGASAVYALVVSHA